ncbi:MAG TPA: hypothetical protein VIY47_12075, partial [Ignavibacteriaceae bacterium]
MLGFVFLFAPIITNENPEFSQNLSVTKLLPPFSSVKQIELINKEEQKLSEIEIFQNESEKIIKPSFSNNIILADSVILSDQIIFYQKNEAYEIDMKVLLVEADIPIIKDKFFLLGTDEFGRDLFARLIYGTRISLTVGLGAVILSFMIGIILGFIAGYHGGFIELI